MPTGNTAPDREIASLAGGCFWCLEAVYDDVKGVDSVVSGYMGGRISNPSYEQVCGGDTRHAEIVQVTFDPDAISFWGILQITEVTAASQFYPAEDYHQTYFARNPFQPYCQYVVAPKVARFRKQFIDRLKEQKA